MSRATVALDRLVTFLISVVLLALGLAALAWWSGRFPFLPDALDLSPLADQPRQPWWPWALGGLGVVLVLLGLRWLVAHLPSAGVSHLNLSGSGAAGRLVASAGPVASAAAEALEATPGVRSARGTIQRDQGQIVAGLSATIEREADLEVVSAAADQVSAQLQQVLQREDLRCRVQLRVAARNRALPRVR